MAYDDYDSFRFAHKKWAEDSLADDGNAYDGRWTRSIAVGGLGLVEKIRKNLGWKALERRVRDIDGDYELREELDTYIAVFGPKKIDIDTENAHFED